jgi:hypothetical protein
MSVQTMTAARQPAKWLPLLMLLTFGVGISPDRLSAEPAVIVNATTGLAISGFDPVAYFPDDQGVRSSRICSDRPRR